jgi:hypothetical protein
VGQSVTLTATASDAEDGTLPGSAVTWTAQRRHGTHFHPYAGPVSGLSFTFTYPAPENLAAAANSNVLVTAAVQDSRGLTTSSSRDLLPRTVALTFATSPAGGSVIVEGTARSTPVTLISWVSAPVQVNVRDQSISGVPYVFSSWSDGGTRAHRITTPATATTYTARLVSGAG